VKYYTRRDVDRFAKNLAALREEQQWLAEHYRTQLDYLRGLSVSEYEYRFAIRAEAAAYRKVRSICRRIEKQVDGSREVFLALLNLSGASPITSDEAAQYGGVFRG